MKILVNKKIKALFYKILFCVVIFSAAALCVLKLNPQNAALYIFLAALSMAAVILVFCYLYFKEQHQQIEIAVTQITEYIAGNHNARIECNEEGELYRLFHEVNSLASILNSHVENEIRAKNFLKNTIADISHQLKTPLAALNIYNGILQEEADNQSTIREFTDLSEQELDRIETLVQKMRLTTQKKAIKYRLHGNNLHRLFKL